MSATDELTREIARENMTGDPLCTCGHPKSYHTPDGSPPDVTCGGWVIALHRDDETFVRRETWCHCDFFSAATPSQVAEWEQWEQR